MRISGVERSERAHLRSRAGSRGPGTWRGRFCQLAASGCQRKDASLPGSGSCRRLEQKPSCEWRDRPSAAPLINGKCPSPAPSVGYGRRTALPSERTSSAGTHGPKGSRSAVGLTKWNGFVKNGTDRKFDFRTRLDARVFAGHLAGREKRNGGLGGDLVLGGGLVATLARNSAPACRVDELRRSDWATPQEDVAIYPASGTRLPLWTWSARAEPEAWYCGPPDTPVTGREEPRQAPQDRTHQGKVDERRKSAEHHKKQCPKVTRQGA